MRHAELIKARLTIDDLVARFGLEPDRAGYVHCPAHFDRTPSLKIYKDNKGFYCFSCQAGGSVIDFYMHFTRHTFQGAVRDLAEILGLDGPVTKKEALGIRRVKQKQSDRKRKQAEKRHWYSKWLKNKKVLEKYKGTEPIEGEWPEDLVKACQNIAYEEYRAELDERKEVEYGSQ